MPRRYEGRFFEFDSLPTTINLRASCFTRRLCLASPLEGRFAFALILPGVAFNCITPYVLAVLDI